MACHSVVATRQNRGHQAAIAHKPGMANGVHAGVYAVQAAGCDAMVDSSGRKAQADQLTPGYQAMLARRQVRDRRVPPLHRWAVWGTSTVTDPNHRHSVARDP